MDLPSNMGIAVNPDIDYVVVESDVTGSSQRYVLAESRLAAYRKELGGDDPDTLEAAWSSGSPAPTSSAAAYAPPFSYFPGHRHAHQVLAADFVTTEDGTGIVHIAPASVRRTSRPSTTAGVAPVVPVGPDGAFTFPVIGLRGPARLRRQPADHRRPQGGHPRRGRPRCGRRSARAVLRRETYDHSYPHCWRCRGP